MMSQKKFSNAKVVIFGGPGVGKTAFAVRYITKRYIGDYASNKEMMYTHKITTSRDDGISLEILDTASAATTEETEKNIRWADGFLLMYSITDPKSLKELEKIKSELLRIKGPEKPVVIVANKCDLVTARCVPEQDGMTLSNELDCPIFEVSVADGYNGVKECMDELLIQLKRDFIKTLTASNVGNPEKSRSRLSHHMRKVFKKRIGRSHSDTF